MPTTATFFGHAAWLIDDGSTRTLIDPFITDNPLTDTDPKDLEKIDYILLSHAHGDHVGDAITIAKEHDALVISTFEVANMISENGVDTHGMHLGGQHEFGFGTLRVFQAFHGSGVPGGHAAGFVLETPAGSIYHAGDTALFGDMKLLNGVIVDHIDLALLPIGSNFTMGLDDAVVATRWISPRIVIPMHYNTFPVIQVDPMVFKERVEGSTDSRVEILKPGDTFTLSSE